jgi:hypothetical protein
VIEPKPCTLAIDIFFAWSMTGNPGHCRASWMLPLMSCLVAPQSTCHNSWERRQRRNPCQMCTSLPRKMCTFLQIASSFADLIGLDPMRSANEAGSLCAWSDKWRDKI